MPKVNNRRHYQDMKTRGKIPSQWVRNRSMAFLVRELHHASLDYLVHKAQSDKKPHAVGTALAKYVK